MIDGKGEEILEQRLSEINNSINDSLSEFSEKLIYYYKLGFEHGIESFHDEIIEEIVDSGIDILTLR